MPENLPQKKTGVARLDRRNRLGRPLGNHPAAAGTALRPHVDDPVGGLDDVQVVLDDDHCIAGVHKPSEDPEELADVLEVQPCGGLVQDVDGTPGGAPLQFGGELDPLCLTAGQRRCRLAEADVTQSHVVEGAQVPGDRGNGGEELRGLLDRHVEDLGDAAVLVVDLQRLPVVPGALADLARHVHVRQEVHFDLDGAVPGAGLAPATLDVEREAPGQIAADLGLGGLGEQPSDVVEDTGVGGRVRARGAPDRRLVDPDGLVEMINSGDGAMPARHLPGAVELVREHRGQDVVDQGGLARAGDAGDRDEAAERERHRHVAQVVLAGGVDGQRAPPGRLPPDVGHRDLAAAG